MRPYQKIQEANVRIEDAVQNNLSELDLSNLELETYQLSFLIGRIENRLPNIESLVLSNNNLTEISPWIKNLLKLKSLSLSNNKLKRIPPEISELKDIEEIELNANELTKIPPEISNLQKLAYINLGQNGFEEFPPELCEIKSLEYLIFNENYISDVPNEISNLQNLRYLDLNRNDLYSEIPDQMCNFPKLEYLDLSENNLDAINDKIVNLHNLQHLCLQMNHIDELPSNIGDFKSLGTLELHGNRLTEVPNSIDNIKDLRLLNLENNPLSENTMHYVINNLGKVDVNFDMTAHEEESDYEKVLALIYPGETDHIITQINNLNPSWEFENGNETVIEAKGTLAKIKSQEIEDPHGTKKVRAQRAIKHNTLNAKNAIIGFLKKIPVDNSKIDEVYSDAAKHLIDLILNESEEDNTRMIELVKMAESLGNCATAVKSVLAQTYVLKYYNVEPKPKNYESLLAREAIESEITSRFRNKIINNRKILPPTEEIEQVQGLVNAIFFEGAAKHVENKCKMVFKDGEKPITLNSKTENMDLSFGIIQDQLAIEFAKLSCETNQNGEPLVNNEGKYIFSLEKLETIKDKILNVKI